jgi:hypothetical protein
MWTGCCAGRHTSEREQLVGHKYGGVVLVPVERFLAPLAKIFLHHVLSCMQNVLACGIEMCRPRLLLRELLLLPC